MKPDAYTPDQMEAARAGAQPLAGRFDPPEAVATVGPAPDDVTLRSVRAEAQEAERARLAQDIHDGPAQALANAIFHVERVERALANDPREGAAELQTLRERLTLELEDVRRFISQVRPPVLDELGLEGAVRDAIAHSSALTGIAIDASLAAPTNELDEADQTVVLRITQEALQNVRKHASARAVSVTTVVGDGVWQLEVRDDGRGFDAAAVAARGQRNFGLQFMRERAELIGARLDVRSRPNEGTIVRLAIPIRDKESR